MKTKLMQLADKLATEAGMALAQPSLARAQAEKDARAALEAEIDRVVAERDALKDTLQDVRGHYERVCKESDALRLVERGMQITIDALALNAELGRIAMRFVDRAGDYCDIDPAERICDQFYKAMADAVVAMQGEPK